MKDNILLLIEDDIKFSRLVDTLRKLNIDAEDYNTHNSTVIFSTLGLSEQEPLFDKYFRMLESNTQIQMNVETDKELAKRVFSFLIGFTTQSVQESLT